jgi:hypothetical protein
MISWIATSQNRMGSRLIRPGITMDFACGTKPSHNSSDPQDYVDYMKNQLAELLILLQKYGSMVPGQKKVASGMWRKSADKIIPECRVQN